MLGSWNSRRLGRGRGNSLLRPRESGDTSGSRRSPRNRIAQWSRPSPCRIADDGARAAQICAITTEQGRIINPSPRSGPALARKVSTKPQSAAASSVRLDEATTIRSWITFPACPTRSVGTTQRWALPSRRPAVSAVERDRPPRQHRPPRGSARQKRPPKLGAWKAPIQYVPLNWTPQKSIRPASGDFLHRLRRARSPKCSFWLAYQGQPLLLYRHWVYRLNGACSSTC